MQIGIIGSGAMGSGIAQVASLASDTTLIFDINPTALVLAENKLEQELENRILKGKISTAEAERIKGNIKYTSTLSEFSTCELVIEAIVENLEAKKQVFKNLEMVVSKTCILASNTSSLSITSIASACENPERVIGIHFFNPAVIMPLVEIIPAIQTRDQTVQKSTEIIAAWGKIIVKAKDTPGFIVNRVARPFYGEAFKMYEEGIAGMATIDWAMKEFGGFRMGPFELTDFIGHDVNYAVTESVWSAFYFDPRFRPSLCQKRLVEAGYLGKKSGKGFYDYSQGNTNPEAKKDEALGKKIFERILAMLINEAADAIYMNICSEKDLETAMTKGVNYPKGLLAWANAFGIEKTVSILDGLFSKYHDMRYRSCPLLREIKSFNI